MTTKRKITLLAVIIFGALAFVPFMRGPNGLIPVWGAYVIFPLSVRAGYWTDLCLASGIIIVVHVGLSVALAALTSQILVRKSNDGGELQPGASPNGGPVGCSVNSGVTEGPPSVT